MNTVHELRKRGFKVRVMHRRQYDNYSQHMRVLMNGGTTIVNVTDPMGHTRTGEAICSVHDQFNRKLGLRIALGRALKQLGMPTK